MRRAPESRAISAPRVASAVQASAYSVLYYLATHVGCLGLFSTHYGMLTEEMAGNPNVALMHMSCHVDEDW
jgi:DNA mismatch repair protein MSH6